jgi:DNA-binding CsgD family transcriptional regulator
MTGQEGFLLHQLLKSASTEPAPSPAVPVRDVPPPPLIRCDERGAEWILSLRSEQMATLASEGLSLEELGQRFGITRDGVKSGLWRARHESRTESSSRDSDIPDSAPPPITGLYESHRRLLASRTKPPSLTSFISESAYRQPFLGNEQERPR